MDGAARHRANPRGATFEESRRKLHRKVEWIGGIYATEDSSVLPEYVVTEEPEEARFKARSIVFAETEKRAGTFFELENESPRSACSTTRTVETQQVPEMLATSLCHEIYYTVLPSTTMATRGPRCLFGRPNSRETMEMLQEALDAERSKFAKRWGVDPCSEDKENNYQRRSNERSDRSPGKKRSNPYSRQTSIHGEQHFTREISTRELYR